jgi:hypothetical protein
MTTALMCGRRVSISLEMRSLSAAQSWMVDPTCVYEDTIPQSSLEQNHDSSKCMHTIHLCIIKKLLWGINFAYLNLMIAVPKHHTPMSGGSFPLLSLSSFLP